jgi:hypothetical protein
MLASNIRLSRELELNLTYSLVALPEEPGFDEIRGIFPYFLDFFSKIYNYDSLL